MEYTCFCLPLSLFFLQCNFMLVLVVSVSNLTTDESALLAFKSHVTTFNPQNTLRYNWSASVSTMCDWVGVTCAGRHGRVVALNLPNMGLGGTIPPSLGNLSFLVSLNLSDNNFHDHLPNELRNLYRLKSIDLPNNYLNGEIPSWFSVFPKLEYLGLRNNNFTGSIPLVIYNISSLRKLDLSRNNLNCFLPNNMCTFLPKLEYLSLSANDLYGQVPSSLDKCSQLQILRLSSNNFTGRIPKNMGNLTKLRELYLGDTNLEGDIPKEIGNLVDLEIFVAENIGLTGFIPRDIFNISSLRVINLSKNRLSGIIPDDICYNLPRLELLNLNTNELYGNLPSSLGKCSQLISIVLGTNKLTGEIPKSIGNLTKLNFLHMNDNNFRGSIPYSIFNISTLTVLSASNNSLSGHFPSWLGLRVQNLERVYLWKNNLSGIIPNSISNASNLIILELSENSFSGRVPSFLGNLNFLNSLDIQFNHFTTESSDHECSFISSLVNCQYLENLLVSFNPLDCFLPTSIGNLSKSLQIFHAKHAKIKGHLPMEIGNLSNVIKLNLGENELSGLIPSTIGKLQSLQGLFLYQNKLEGVIPYDVCNLKRLSNLYLFSNFLYGDIPTCLSNVTTLRYLYLDSNKLSSSLPSTLWSLTYLLQMNLSCNNLSGSLPLEVGNLKVLMLLDLSHNKLSGVLPSSISAMKDITNLSLAYNDFQGIIPTSFGELISLEILDLSGNNLSGLIPKSLESLLHLKQFNVSFNKLVGEVPVGGVFGNFSWQSFMGNYALCGSSRLRLPRCEVRHPKGNSTHLLIYIFPGVVLVILLVVVWICIKCRRRKENVRNQEILIPFATWRRFSHLELQRATDGFCANKLLGIGAFGSVYKGSLEDGTDVAIKVFNVQHEERFKSFDVECEILRNVRHRNLVKVISCCSENNFKALVLEFMPKESLEKWLYSPNCFLDIFRRLTIMIDIGSALEYLHHGHVTQVVHCDLKPSNILLDEHMVACLSDFGISKLLQEGKSKTETLTLATIGYMAPEYGSRGIISVKSDVYSYGILLMETFTRRKPTDEMFFGEMSLKQWVKESLSSGDIVGIVDSNLLGREATSFTPKANCVSSVLRLALSCAAELPQERESMKDVVVTLKKIKQAFLKDTEGSMSKADYAGKHIAECNEQN